MCGVCKCVCACLSVCVCVWSACGSMNGGGVCSCVSVYTRVRSSV